MRRLLERLDEIGSTIVPLAYLAGLFLGTASYFTGYRGWSVVLAVGIGLALGSEVHSFLQQRRARAAFAEYRRIRKAGGDASDAREVFRFNAGLLAALVAFQCFTATMFAAATWPVSGNWLAVAAQDALRGCIIPAFFLLSGFLVPLTQSAAAVLTHASDDILHTAVSRNVRHWRHRIQRVHRRGGDLSPLMVALLHEAGEHAAARRTTLIADNLTLAEAHMLPPWYARLWGRMRGAPDGVVSALLPGQSPTLPTGPGTPLPAPAYEPLPASEDDETWRAWRPGVLYPERSSQSNAGAVASERVPVGELSPEAIRRASAFGLLDSSPRLSVSALAKALKCRWETARDLHAAWTDHRLAQQRGMSPRPLPARMVESSGEADEGEQREERAV